MLVALLLLLVLTVRTAGVSLVSSISSTLDIVSMTIGFMMSINNLGLSLDNVRVVVDLFMLLSTMSDDNILTLLNISNILLCHSQQNILHDFAALEFCDTGNPSYHGNEDHHGKHDQSDDHRG